MTTYAQGHGGDAGGSPPHRYSASASGCQSSRKKFSLYIVTLNISVVVINMLTFFSSHYFNL